MMSGFFETVFEILYHGRHYYLFNYLLYNNYIAQPNNKWHDYYLWVFKLKY